MVAPVIVPKIIFDRRYKIKDILRNIKNKAIKIVKIRWERI